MHLDMSGSSLLNQQPFPEPSPKKRSDATMDLDESTENSPKAKRRSYGPLNLGDSFNIFDHFPKASAPIEIHDDSPREYDWTSHVATSPLDPYSTTQASMPRRAGSLRRSTLQQRHNGDRPSLTRRAGVASLSALAASPQNSPEAGTPNTNRPRLSIDSFTPLGSGHSFVEAFQPSINMLQATQRHPLARTITTSSSGSSLPDDSPTHFPVHNEKPRARMNFSKSLPLGAVRPRPDYPGGPVGSVSTPDYKHARPYEGAFASTGLVSKMIRNPEERLPAAVFGAAVPDTPCKKPPGLPRRPSHGFATYPPPPPSGLGKRGGRFNRHQGSPTTPFGHSSPNEPPRPVLFQGFNSRHSRKGSLFSLYNEGARSPSKNADEMDTCDESSMPPTPTKNQSANQSFNSVSGLLGESPTTDRFPPPSMPTNSEVTPWRLGNASSNSLDRFETTDNKLPQTPQEGGFTPDGGHPSLPSSGDSFLFPGNNGRGSILPPATPTARQHTFARSLDRRVITPVHGMSAREPDHVLSKHFGKVEFIGRGEFSEVYKVVGSGRPLAAVNTSFFGTPAPQYTTTPTSPPPAKVFAVKKLTMPIQGAKDRKLRMREVDALQSLRGCDHVLQLIDNWEENNSLYIQTEYCEEGNLKEFLSEVGAKGRLDDFRIWKIMFEMAQGLGHIHVAGFVHRDLKPSNVLVGFDGTLKIGDFGLATALQDAADPVFDFDGDREYLAPEALRSEIDTPADIFSLGLIMLEIAANVKLPENGATWTALREGDFSEIPVLTQVGDAVQRDAEGMPLEETERNLTILDNDGSAAKGDRRNYMGSGVGRSGDIFGLRRTGSTRKTELQQAPLFMSDPNHGSSLDTVVRRMLAAVPILRFTASDLLELEALTWVGHRRRAGATVFEGNWGPGNEVVDPSSFDTEMTDV